MKDIEKEVVDVLTENPENIEFEDIQSEQYSPLNQAVVEKDIAAVDKTENWNIWKPETGNNAATEQIAPETSDHQTLEEASTLQSKVDLPPIDAPEQEIGSDASGNTTDSNFKNSGDNISESTFDSASDSASDFELPTPTAKQAADTILGMTNNVLGVGGGFFVKIKKHKEFYDFDEIVQLIEQQNERNVQRIKLDKEDKALLKPLIVLLLKKKAKKLTPEQQLTGAILSILIKKAQTVMEVRAENEILVDRILDIVREEKGYSDQDVKAEPKEEDVLDSSFDISDWKQENEQEHKTNDVEDEDSKTIDLENDNGILDVEGVVEIAEEPLKEKE